ncbi:MAG: hypothetical protein IRY99_16395, partial [Isosphaeraceae bacterium]|nr:hypothetical protein [Isosphaeraceae bacterium]
MRNVEFALSLDAAETCQSSPAPRAPRRIGLWVLVLLIAGASLAVGTVSVWLVPPYLLLMAWLLLPRAERGGLAAGPGRAAAEGAPLRDGDVPEAPPISSPMTDEPLAESDPAKAPEPAPAKPRRGKGRGRGRPKAVPAPTAVTWVRIGPGKFVRVEAPASASAPA